MKAAFFDLDHTVISCNSQARLALFLARRGVLTFRKLIYPALWYLGRVLHHALIDEVLLRERCYQCLAQFSTDQANDLFYEFCEQRIAPSIYAAAKRRMEEHRGQGHQIVIISASLYPIVGWVAQQLHADAYFGTELEIKNNAYTGKLKGHIICGKEKADWVKKWSMKNSVSLFDSYAYGNSLEDMHMLKIVGHPIAINPDGALKKIALSNQWPKEKWMQ